MRQGVSRGDTGFEDAFDELFPRAFRLALRIVGDAAAAEDVAAEALARAYAVAEGGLARLPGRLGPAGRSEPRD